MKSKASFLTGMILGAVLLSGGMVFAADTLEVLPSADNIYLNGEHVTLRGYIVNGHNYMRLDDLSKLIGFGLKWDNETKQVHMFTETTEQPDQVAPYEAKKDENPDVPKVGDVFHCDDGTEYKVSDVSRYDNNVFADGPLGPLPEPTCDWNSFPDVTFPAADTRHIKSGDRDVLFVRNLHETRRMLYTIYNALGQEPDAWRGGKPLAELSLTIPAELDPYVESFWPWHPEDLEDLVASRPNSHYYLEAWDYYLNGVFQYTRYQVVSM